MCLSILHQMGALLYSLQFSIIVLYEKESVAIEAVLAVNSVIPSRERMIANPVALHNGVL